MGRATLLWVLSAVLPTMSACRTVRGRAESPIATGVVKPNPSPSADSQAPTGDNPAARKTLNIDESQKTSITKNLTAKSSQQYPQAAIQTGPSITVYNDKLSVSAYTPVYSSAIVSIIWNNKEFVLNDVTTNGKDQKRGASLQSVAFFDARNGTYYNECNNPLEAGSFSDFSAGLTGITSPTSIQGQGNEMKMYTQMGYWLDPYLCNPATSYQKNNAALSNNYLSKKISVGAMGIKNLIAFDIEYQVGSNHNDATFDALVGSHPLEFFTYHTYDPRNKNSLTQVNGRDEDLFKSNPEVNQGSSFSLLPTIISTADKKFALGYYSPQIPFEANDPSFVGAYIRSVFRTQRANVLDLNFRRDALVAGVYRYKAYLVVGTVKDVRESLDTLYENFRILDSSVFDADTYRKSNSQLSNMSVAELRYHWITVGIHLGLKAHATGNIENLYARFPEFKDTFGKNYADALTYYVKSSKDYPL